MSVPTYIYPPVTLDPGQLYDAFTAYMQAQIPNWKPYSGELDDWLARAFTAIGAQLGEIESDVATSIFRYFGAYIMGYPPYDAAPATGSVTITVVDNAGYTIPAFTGFSFPDTSGNLQGFETLVDIVIPNGSTSITVTVQAITPGSAGNGCSGTGDLDASTPITFITGLTMAASSSEGSDAEDDPTYLNRLTQLMTTVTPSPITPQDFSTIAGTQLSVGRAFTLPAFNPGTWTLTGNLHSNTTVDGIADASNIPVGAPIAHADFPSGTFVKAIVSSTQITTSAAATATVTGATLTVTGQLNQGGMVTSWIVAPDGTAPSSPLISTVQATIQAMCLSNVVYSVESPTYTTVPVTAAVVAWPGNSTSAVQAAVEAAISAFLTPGTFGQMGAGGESPWLNETVVRLAALQTTIMNLPGVHYVGSLLINGASSDFPLPGVVPLPEPGTITVTVTTG